MKMALIVYWSKTGNTEKVALAMKEGFERAGFKVDVKRVEGLKTWTSSITISFV